MLYEPRGLLGSGSFVARAARACAAQLKAMLAAKGSYAANP
jgi:hypothetical protein